VSFGRTRFFLDITPPKIEGSGNSNFFVDQPERSHVIVQVDQQRNSSRLLTW
jgi:hypothetical protein